MIKTFRIMALLLSTVALLSAGLALPAQAVPPAPYCYGGPGPTKDLTYKHVVIHTAVPCQWLDVGNSWYFGNARLTINNGSLVIFDQNNKIRWTTGTNGSGASQLVFQQDGNLVLYTPGYARAVWATGTEGDCGALTTTLSLQKDSNFVIYCRLTDDYAGMYPIWSTGTLF
jgi:hypothetical protein